MKILITGITGLLGRELLSRLGEDNEIIGFTNRTSVSGALTHKVDITDRQAVYDAVSKINPDILINSAAISNVDACEKDPEEAFRVNALGTRNLCLACQRYDASMLHISTDYVFSGNDAPKDGYCEFDDVGPVNYYAKTKLYAEWYVQNLMNKFFIVRTSWLFGESRPNYISQISDDLIAKKEVKASTDVVSAPTYVKDLSEALETLIRSSSFGIYHLNNSGFASRYDIASFIANETGCGMSQIKKITMNELNLAAKRPVFSGMQDSVWQREGRKALRPWQDAVKEFLKLKGIL